MRILLICSWYFESVSRKEADKLLLADENPRGTFLVRPSEHNPNGYSLSGESICHKPLAKRS